MTTWTTLATPERRATLVRRAQIQAGVSVAHNTVEAVIAITAGRPMPVPPDLGEVLAHH